MAAPSKIRLGTASPGTQATTPETLAQLERIARQAADKKIDILLLPEAYIGGYPRGAAFGSVIGGRSTEGRDEYLRHFQSAVDLGDTVGDGAGAGDAWVKRELGIDGVPVAPIAGNGVSNGDAGKITPNRGDGTREQLERIARETGVFLVIGCMEKAGGSLYCAVVYVCPKLGMTGKRRKVMPTGSERLVWAQGSPETLRAVSTTIRGVRINMAAAICWENYMPLLRQALYAQNINLYLAPTADARDSWLSLIRTIGIEGRCFVISSNMCVRDGLPLTNPPATHEPVFSEEKQDTTMTDQPDPQPTRRRTSCVTEEGFEIALPSSPTQIHRPSVKSKRRKSVFDKDGNEIVLCCKDEDEDADGGQNASPTGSSTRTWARAAAVARSHVPKPLAALNGDSKTATAKTSSAKFLCRGGSSIVSPFGDVLAGPQWEDDSGIIYVDVDFEDCIRGRLDMDTAGSYSRNDSFKFSVQGLDLSPLPY